jgi:hypothetical protein
MKTDKVFLIGLVLNTDALATNGQAIQQRAPVSKLSCATSCKHIAMEHD